MMEKQLKKYLQLNSMAQKGETVFFGSTFLAAMNFGEFAQRFLPDLSVQINLHAVAALVEFSLMQT